LERGAEAQSFHPEGFFSINGKLSGNFFFSLDTPTKLKKFSSFNKSKIEKFSTMNLLDSALSFFGIFVSSVGH